MDILPGTAGELLARVARAQSSARLPSLVAGVVRDGALVWHAGRGRVAGETPGPDVQYRIGSITKTITAITVLRLRDAGLVALGDRLEDHVPGTTFGEATIGQLLAHRGGVQAETAGPWWERTAVPPWDELVDGIGAQARTHLPGLRFHYSNLGFAALGELIARRRGRPWFDVVADEVLAPLGMGRTTYRPVPPAAPGLAVHPFADVVLPEPEFDAGALAAAGQLWSTPSDLGRLAAFLLGDTADVLSADTLAEMKEPALTRTGEDRPGYGLGLQIGDGEDGRRLAGHAGAMPGFVAHVVVDDAARLGAVWTANTTYGGDWALGPALLDIVCRSEPPVAREWRPAPPPDGVGLEQLGTWFWGPNAFTLRATGSDRLELAPLDRGGASRFRRRRAEEPPGAEWVGIDGYHAGERLRFAADGSHFELATFVFTRWPYDGGPIPGGVDPGGWTAQPPPGP